MAFERKGEGNLGAGSREREFPYLRAPATQVSSSDMLLFFDSLISRTPIAFLYGVCLRKSFAWTHSYVATVIASVLATETYVTRLNVHTEKLNNDGDDDTENAE